MDDPAKNIKAWRHSLGMTQDEFAKASGIPKATLVGYEVGQRKPGYEALAAIAETGCNISWLLTGKGEMRDAAREKPLQGKELRVIAGEGRPLTPDELQNSNSRRLSKIAELLDAMPEQESAALLDELFSRAHQAAELAELKRAVAELRATHKKTA